MLNTYRLRSVHHTSVVPMLKCRTKSRCYDGEQQSSVKALKQRRKIGWSLFRLFWIYGDGFCSFVGNGITTHAGGRFVVTRGGRKCAYRDATTKARGCLVSEFAHFFYRIMFAKTIAITLIRIVKNKRYFIIILFCVLFNYLFTRRSRENTVREFRNTQRFLFVLIILDIFYRRSPN